MTAHDHGAIDHGTDHTRQRIDSTPRPARPEYRGLETGDILYFPISPPLLPEADRAFLVTQKQVNASYHKNVSYRPLEDRLKGSTRTTRRSGHESTRSCVAIRNGPSRSWRRFLKRYAGELEDRLRELSADRGIRAAGFAALAERPAALRLVPDPAVARRSFAADLHQHSPGAHAGLDHHRTTSRIWPVSSPSGSACIGSRVRWRPAST